MISHKFSNLSDDSIVGYISGHDKSEPVIGSVKSVTDLWLLANIKESYYEANAMTDNFADYSAHVCAISPQRGKHMATGGRQPG